MALKTVKGAEFGKIMGVGGYRPRRVVDNAEIVTYIDSSDEWIRTRSGIVERRWASEDETVSMMSQAAARKALERAGVEPGQVDTVIVSTVTHLHQTPAIATTIASELGAKNAAAFDISAACAGFCYATAMADSFIRTGASKYVLIIGVERLSDMTDKHDRSTAFIFADGAGAAVVGPSDTPAIGPVVWGSDGDQADLIAQTESWDSAMDADAHDRAVALVSHTPQLVSSLVAARLEHAEDAAVRLCGQGILDVTRIAGSEPGMWMDILAANPGPVADVLAALATDLAETVTALRALQSADDDKRRGGAVVPPRWKRLVNRTGAAGPPSSRRTIARAVVIAGTACS